MKENHLRVLGMLIGTSKGLPGEFLLLFAVLIWVLFFPVSYTHLRERPLPMNLKIWSFGIPSSYNCIVKLFLSRQSIENLATAVRPFKAVPIGCPRTVYVFFPTLATGRNG